MYDSGIRGASVIFKALALGAKFVFVGRLWVWALSIGGEVGVRHVMKALLADVAPKKHSSISALPVVKTQGEPRSNTWNLYQC